MKTLTTYLLLFGLLVLVTPSSGQVPAVLGSNIVKWNVSALALSQYSIQYEHVLGLNHSYALGFGISPDVDLPFKKNLLDAFGGNDDAKRAIESTKFTKITVTPEYRFYISKGAPGGFYIATFMRYTHMTIDQDYTFTPSDNLLHTAHLTGKLDGVGAGAMIGTQWLLGPSVTIDFWMVGPFIGAMDASFHGVDNIGDLTPQDQADLKSDIESFKIPLWTPEATVTSNTVDVKMKGPFYGVRMLGVCFGVRF